MNDYIKRQDVIEMLEKANIVSDHISCGYDTEDVYIEKIPAADVIEVVRCEHCQYWNGMDEFGDGSCNNPDGIDNIAKADDFCSYGKRI